MLGVESVCGQWAEWLTSVPLIVYMTIAIEDKLVLSRQDYIIISSCVMCIVFGFVMNFPWINSAFGVALLVLSFGSIGVTIVFLNHHAGQKPSSDTVIRVDQSSHEEENSKLAQLSKMRSIASLLLWVFPFFGIIHLLGWRQLLNRDGVFIGNFCTLLIYLFLFFSIDFMRSRTLICIKLFLFICIVISCTLFIFIRCCYKSLLTI